MQSWLFDRSAFPTFPSSVTWFIWKERNYGTFKGIKQPVVVMKLIFLRTLCDWMAAMGGHSLFSLLDLLDCSTFF